MMVLLVGMEGTDIISGDHVGLFLDFSLRRNIGGGDCFPGQKQIKLKSVYKA
jgi:hypothetical protein